MVYIERTITPVLLVMLLTVMLTEADRLWNSLNNPDTDDTISNLGKIDVNSDSQLLDYLVSQNKEENLPYQLPAKRFRFAPMRGKRFYNDLEIHEAGPELPTLTNSNGNFPGPQGHDLSDENELDLLRKVLKSTLDLSAHKKLRDSSVQKRRFRFTALRGRK